ncbi:xanthine dehydrogenase family protein molybdopterin-binding subunit [Novacetimonas pomaceti]|uniref:Xanthine dehydrogenase family protein molybdopterin-binding subunit n=1 Tax=Novacetimonas pomaceti TaxID=2021998 RepID=A0ABX5P3G9_9PROT|nr:xanthine dehydrogenase family protein molybdopterin-binding subunit [Novacetimonas pomaceti]PYD47991.1 xanthine dehydrogenase family protein molybdopterin-binding subunit [Novacetimonas pomaceti]
MNDRAMPPADMPDTAAPLIGAGMQRVESALKVRGEARYAYEMDAATLGVMTEPLVGVMVLSTIARGRITATRTATAQAMPGVRLIMTADNAPAQAPWGPLVAKDRFARAQPVLRGTNVHYYGEPVALVVADTLEEARAAAMAVDVRYDRLPHDVLLDAARATEPEFLNGFKPAKTEFGAFDTSYAGSEIRVEAIYETPHQNHAQMEPHATTAVWQGDTLILHTSAQNLVSIRNGIAATLQISPHRVRVISPYVGGGFGGKLPYFADAILAGLAARALGKPVKVGMTRPQMFSATTHRTATRQTLRIGADRSGRLRAISHDALSHCASFDNFVEDTTTITRGLYRADAIRTTAHLNHLDLPRSDSMRSPGDAVGMIGLECAMDEVAHATGIDPVELRLLNDTPDDLTARKPFSSRHLKECLEEGARRFEWAARNPLPGQTREGEWLIGMGMACAMRYNLLKPCQALAHLDVGGNLTVQLAMTDPGTGTQTILTQIAAAAMGLSPTQVHVEMGDTAYPPAPGSGGSFGAESAGSAVLRACENLRELLLRASVANERSPLHGLPREQLHLGGGNIHAGNRHEALSALMERAFPHGVDAHGQIEADAASLKWSQASFGAHFVEVAVSAVTGETRVRRMLGVFACGRILNRRTARSQLLGGMVWGVSNALHEENAPDPRTGQFMAHDLANYHVSTHADMPEMDVVMIAEDEPVSNPLHIKGLGEVGICGAPAAIGNAIFNATGIRVRSFPITPDQLLPHLPAVTV